MDKDEQTEELEDTASRRPAIRNITMAVANTEYRYQFPKSVKKFTLHCRDGTAFRLAFQRGKVALPTEPYFTVLANVAYNEDNLDVEELHIYFACGAAAKVIEIIAWN